LQKLLLQQRETPLSERQEAGLKRAWHFVPKSR
jgi:hypothetical protein